MRAIVAAGILTFTLGTAVAFAQAGGVAARVNGIAIAHKDVEHLAAKMSQGTGMSADEVWNDALDQLITLEVLIQAATADGIKVTPVEVDQELKDLKAESASNPALAKAFAGNAEAETRKELQRSLLIDKFMQKHTAAKVSEQEIRAYYDENQDQFERPKMVRASHILIKIQNNDSAAARKRIDEILQRIKKGENFAEIAKSVSQDSLTASKGGDLGFFPHRPTPLADAAFSLGAGQLSDIIQTPYGFHIIEVTDSRAPGLAQFSEVHDDIKTMLEEEQSEEKEDEFVDSLKAKAKIEILETKPASKKQSAAIPGGAQNEKKTP